MRRRLLSATVLGLAVMTGGTTYLSATGHAADANVAPIAQGLRSFSQALGGLAALDELGTAVPLTGLLPAGPDGLRLDQVFEQSLGKPLADRLGGSGFDEAADLEAFLNDPDGQNGTGNDGNVDGLAVDIGGTVVPAGTGLYDITLTLQLLRGGTTPLTLTLPELDASAGTLTKDLELAGSLTFRYDASKPEVERLALLADQPQVLTADLGLGLTSDFLMNVGLTTAQAAGRADVAVQLVTALLDPTPNGRITRDDWQSTAPLDLFEVTRGPSSAAVDLTLTSDIAGVPTGKITLADNDLADGVGAPTLALGPLGDFRNMTPMDFLGGLAQVAQALDALSFSGPASLDLPLMSDSLSDLVVPSQRIQDFFTSTGLADPTAPLTLGPGPGKTAKDYEATLAQYDTLQELKAPLAKSLGVPIGLLAFAFDPGSRRLKLTLAESAAEEEHTPRTDLEPKVDVGNQLERLGITAVESAASKVTLTPTVGLDLDLSVDLTPRTGDQTTLQKFAVSTDGTELAVDFPMKAHLDLVGKIGFLGLTLTDAEVGNDGTEPRSVPVLSRRTADLPMLSVDLDGGADKLLTLEELYNLITLGTSPDSDGSIAVGVNAQVPAFDLVATATADGGPLASGALTVAWPDIAVGQPSVVGKVDFNDQLLGFGFDHKDPLALFNQITSSLSTFASALDGLSEQAAGKALARDLPLTGQSFDDLANRLGQVRAEIDALVADPPGTLQVLERRLEEALGMPLGITRSSGGPAAILFDLSYGICTAQAAGCTQVTGPKKLPLNLDLGENFGGIVGVGGNGEVTLNYRALASLDFGVELPTVTAGAQRDTVPQASGSPKAFVVDTSEASLKADVTVGGVVTAAVGPLTLSLGKAGDEVDAKMAASMRLFNDVAPAGATRVPLADLGSFVQGMAPSSIRPAAVDRVTCAAPVNGPFDACARIPVYEGGTSLGTITLRWSDLNQLSGAEGPQVDAAAVFDAFIARGFDFDRILEGMRQLEALLRSSLQGSSYGQKIPVVGDALDAGADIGETFNAAVVKPLEQLKTELQGVSNPVAVQTKIRDFLSTKLQAEGVNLLKDRSTPANGVDADDVVVNATCDDGNSTPDGRDAVDGQTACTTSHLASDLYDLQIGLAIGQVGVTDETLDFDLGLPGLRLAMSDKLTASASWELDLAFGMSVVDGFYLSTDNPFNRESSGAPKAADDELTLSTAVELPDTVKGDIAFLPFVLTDSTTGPGTKDLDLVFSTDLLGGGTSKRLSLSDLAAGISPTDGAALEATLGGRVNLSFKFRTGPLGTEQSQVPTFVADFLLDWDFSKDNVLDGDVGDLTIAFNNVGIDLGSLLDGFLDPILDNARKFTKPLQPVVDLVTTPIPGLSDAAAAFKCPLELPFPQIIAGLNLCTVSLLDVYERQSGTDLTLIRQVIGLLQFINSMESATSGKTLTLGSFTLDPATTNAGAVPAGHKDSLVKSAPASIPNPLQAQGNDGLEPATIEAIDKARTKTGVVGGFTFPAFDAPANLFHLLLGKDVTLIHWDAGPLEAGVTIPLEFGPPIGPLPLSIGVTIKFGVRGHFAVGYDTKGIRLAVQRSLEGDGSLADAGALFAGIGIDDRLRVNGEPTGEDIPEITLFGSLTAKAAFDVFIAEAGIRGGVAAELNANLHDGGFGPANHQDPPNQDQHLPENLDGVLRIEEIASFLENPVCLFDYTGRITAFLEAYIDYTLGEETFTIVGPVTLYDFGEILKSACDTEPVLAHVTNVGVPDKPHDLVLHLGAFADQREFQEDVKNERFVVRQLDIAGTRFSVTAFGFEQEFEGVDGKVFGHGGDGDDTISLEPGASLGLNPDPKKVDVTGIPFTRQATLCGGLDNDTLKGGSGNDTIVGDGGVDKAALTCSTTEAAKDGIDDIDAGGGADVVHGGGAKDKINGGDGGDTIDGGTGNDTILGGFGDKDARDVIRGGPDSLDAGKTDLDVVFAGPGDDEVDGGADKDAIDGGDGGDILRGGPGDDTLHGRLGKDRLEGQADHDILYGNEDDDTLLGGTGDDDLLGEDGDDVLSGGADNDDLVGGRDNTGVADDADVGDTLNGDAGKDYLVGDEGTIVRPAGQEAGTLACTGTFAGDDTMNGGADDDLMLGCAGVDVMHGDGGADVMHGSDGDDDMFGDDGTDTMFGDRGVDEMEGNADNDVMRGGHDGDVMKGNDGVDTMFGDSGEDFMYGNAGNDVMRGNADDDHMEGNADSDTMNGDGGDDLLIGGTSTAGQLDAGDVMSGGIGEDHLIGDNGIEGTLYDLDAGDATLGGPDQIDGGPDNDEAFGGLDDDIVRGGAGEDHLEGNNASDTIHGEGGSDNILGGTTQLAGGTTTYPDEGDDIFGGDADDVILGDNGRIVNAATGGGTPILRNRGLAFERAITLYDLGHTPDDSKAGDDTVSGGDGPDIVLGQGEVDTLHGDAAADFVAGGQAGDTIYGDDGQDDLVGGSYVVHTGEGQDRVGQLDGSDTVYGGSGADVILGDNGQILLHTEAKSEITQNRAPMTPRLVEIYDLGDTPVAGTSAGDWLLGEDAPDVILGQSGTDRIAAGAAEDYAEGGPDTDWIEGNGGDDDLVGGSAAPLGANTGRTTVGQLDDYDVIWGGADDDLIIGDNAIVDRVGTPDELTYRIGTNPAQTIIDRRAIQLLDLEYAGDTLQHDPDRSGGDYLSGQGGVDVLLGQDGADRISGGSADDYAEGHGAGDTINGDAALEGVPTTVAAPGWPGDPTDGYAADGAPDGQDDLLGGKSEVGFRDGADTIHGDGESDFVLGDNGTAVREILGEVGALLDRPYALRYGTPTPTNAAKIRVADSDFPSTRFCDPTLDQCERAEAFAGDLLHGDGGDDFLYGQDGDDSVWGGSEDDDIYGELGSDRLYGEAGDDAILGDRGGVRDRYETGADTFNLSVRQVPKVSYEGFSGGSVTRITDLLHDVNGDVFVGAGSGDPMPHNGRDEGGDDRIRGGLDDDSIHAGFGDDLANGDSGGDIVFGDDGADVLWGGKGCDAETDTVVTKPYCYTADGTFDPAPHQADGSTVPAVTDYLLGGKGGTSPASLDGALGSDILDWRARGSYDPGVGCTTGAWPADLAPLGKKGASTTIDPCSWFEMTNLDNDSDADNQHHQGIDWQYGGWDRDVLQGDQADNGPNEGDRLLDWDGAYNLYTHCNAAYGGFNDVRQHSPTWQSFLERMVYGLGAGQQAADATTDGTSAFVELALVYPGKDREHGSGKAYPATPGHFDDPNACAE